ncbi:putative MFS transporter [Aspergillus clavatus NRRL 1]|uniref:Citrate exporter 1 n=1 Tax=Aspergillus clavatus (strain ATCC 1007 / CBS 513.65 / DSM 816 / NCTC 3887 / NRRL 1 / QM 1276 / 107) TaxID=344612 RepID=A1CD45_ASPCL|nr:MFS transporter, putative [Aspergillus clavatus NRRL 1]EAW12452.1 MFS transporter, putative [Aspergillus clavatus NRRL 1]
MASEQQPRNKDIKIPVENVLPKPTPPRPPYTEFSSSRQRLILAIITVAGFLGPLAGNIYLPALPILAQAFGVNTTRINVTVTVFMVVFAVGPLFWSSLADWKGRRPLYIISLLIYMAANVLLAALPANYGALIVLRILQAFGSSAVVSMGAGTVADTTEPKYRARAMSYFVFGPQCGPILGPVIGGALAGNVSWRWIFGFLAILGFCAWLVLVFFLPETLRARVGNGAIYTGQSWLLFPPTVSSPLAPESDRGPAPPKPSLKGYWSLFRYPPIGIACVNTAILYSSYFCVAIQLPTALGDVYHWTTTEVGAGYLVVGIAMVIGSVLGGQFSDWRRARAVSRVGEENVHPESRLDDQIWGLFSASAGLIMFGFFVDYAIHPVAPLIATFLIGFGMSWMFVASNAFLTSCVPQRAAGAFALGNMLRSPAAAVAAVIIEPLVRRMTWGYCFLGLGLLDLLGIGVMLIVLRIHSPRWRQRKFAPGGPGTPGTPGASGASGPSKAPGGPPKGKPASGSNIV